MRIAWRGEQTRPVTSDEDQQRYTGQAAHPSIKGRGKENTEKPQPGGGAGAVGKRGKWTWVLKQLVAEKKRNKSALQRAE